jgi:hypothetical protein
MDLMDFRAMADGEYKWVLQVKCSFSRYIWLYALKDKTAASVCAIMTRWFSENGLSSKLYVSLFIFNCFKS